MNSKNESLWTMTRITLPGVSDDELIETNVAQLQRFAELVRADERERCAKVCETAACGGSNFNVAAEYCAVAIRNRAPRGAEGG